MMSISAPFALILGEHFTQRKVVMIGTSVGFILISLSSLMYNMEYVNLMYGFGAGIANACMFGNGLVILGQYFNKYRSVANGLALSGSSIGTFAIPPLLQFLLNKFGLHGTLLLIGGIYFNVCICGALYRPTSFYNRKKKSDIPLETVNDNGTAKSSGEQEELLENDNDDMSNTGSKTATNMIMGSMESLHAETLDIESKKEDKQQKKITIVYHFVFVKVIPLYVLKIPVVIFFAVFSFFVFIGYFNFVIFLPTDLVTRDITGYEKALMVSIVGIGDLIGRIIAGILGNLDFVQRYVLLGICCVACGIQIIVFSFASHYWWIAIHVALYGFFGGGFVALNALVLIDFVGLKLMPKALGIVLFIQGLGAGVGQPLEGMIRDATGTFLSLNLINGIAMVFGGLIIFLYPIIKNIGQDAQEVQVSFNQDNVPIAQDRNDAE